MITDLKINVTIICKSNGLLKQIDINKYQRQYKNLKVEVVKLFQLIN